MTSKHILNLDILRGITDGNAALEKKLFELYRVTADNCLREMEAGIAAENSKKWNDYVHQMKGAAANIGAEEVKTLCAEAEFFGEDESDIKSTYYTSIKQALERLYATITDINKDTS